MPSTRRVLRCNVMTSGWTHSWQCCINHIERAIVHPGNYRFDERMP